MKPIVFRLFAFFLLLGSLSGCGYNTIQQNDEAVKRAWGDLESQLQRRADLVERYPDIKATQNFRDLQNQLEGTENRISVARQRYNGAVEIFNFSIRQFPNSITNSLLLKLKAREYFKADAAAQAVPEVKF